MFASFDRLSPVTLSADVLSMSWKGDARRGWLATGNSKKTVGVTYTEICDEDEFDVDPTQSLEQYYDTEQVWALEKQAMRRNFNFREHTHEVTIVRWNHHLDKIATCDTTGTVIVWRNHSGRSIMELVNSRGVAISDFQWSNDGNKVLIAYIDGYVLVGTAYGRRIWARQLNLGSFVTSPNHTQSSKLLSSTWSPDDARIVVGSSIGELIELDAVHGGTLVSTTEVLPGIGIIGLQWVMVPKSACQGSDAKRTTSATTAGASGSQHLDLGRPAIHNHVAAAEGSGDSSNSSFSDSKSKGSVRLSLYLRNGKVVLMNSCGDQQATIIRTGLVDGKMLWSRDGCILTVAGFRKSQSMSTVRFFRPSGQLLFTLPLKTKEPVTAITWGHSDRKLFVATKSLLHMVKISREIPSLQSFCQGLVAGVLGGRPECFDLVLPTKLKVEVAGCFDPLIQGHVPQSNNLLSYVCRPPPSSHRTYCIVIPNPNSRDAAGSNNTSGSSSSSSQRYRHPTSYTLYVEHLGTIIPILEATKRSFKIRQAFSIYLPTSGSIASSSSATVGQSSSDSSILMDTSEGTVTPNQSNQVRVVGHESHLSLNTEVGVQVSCREDDAESPRHPISSGGSSSGASATSGASADGSSRNLNSHHHHTDLSRHLAEVTSNVMASKFRIQGISDKVPADMGSIMIKTSFLHIQPRKVIAYLPHPETSPDSGIDSDSSSDESMEEGNASAEVDASCSADVFMEPESHSIESLMSMEELQLPKTAEPETQASLVEAAAAAEPKSSKQSHSVTGSLPGGYSCTSTNVKGQRVSVSESHIQIHSKTPTWNEQHMIYQLDFGGRVTTKSAKNFQLEMDNEQVLQFGRIDNGCFILDFQAPFSPIQAFATALANLV